MRTLSWLLLESSRISNAQSSLLTSGHGNVGAQENRRPFWTPPNGTKNVFLEEKTTSAASARIWRFTARSAQCGSFKIPTRKSGLYDIIATHGDIPSYQQQFEDNDAEFLWASRDTGRFSSVSRQQAQCNSLKYCHKTRSLDRGDSRHNEIAG